jgi:hypothetical protein
MPTPHIAEARLHFKCGLGIHKWKIGEIRNGREFNNYRFECKRGACGKATPWEREVNSMQAIFPCGFYSDTGRSVDF